MGGTEAEFTDWYCKEIQSKIDDMEKNGIKFAGFLADSIFSSDGVHPNPRGFSKAAVDAVHKNGGVFIADEVQPGFARTGDAFLGFELVSDIEKKTPDQKKALDLIELLRDNQVLTSCCGPFGNVLKIRPTLAFASHDIDWVASALDKCLTQLENA